MIDTLNRQLSHAGRPTIAQSAVDAGVKRRLPLRFEVTRAARV